MSICLESRQPPNSWIKYINMKGTTNIRNRWSIQVNINTSCPDVIVIIINVDVCVINMYFLNLNIIFGLFYPSLRSLSALLWEDACNYFIINPYVSPFWDWVKFSISCFFSHAFGNQIQFCSPKRHDYLETCIHKVKITELAISYWHKWKLLGGVWFAERLDQWSTTHRSHHVELCMIELNRITVLEKEDVQTRCSTWLILVV